MQQTLGWTIEPRRDYGVWIRHAGVEEACNRLALWLVQGGMLRLTSRQPAGKSHLLAALAGEHPELGLVRAEGRGGSVQLTEVWAERLEHRPFWAVDVPGGAIGRPVALALFHLIERARCLRRPMLVAWRAEGAVPPELSSRLAAMDRVEMHPPGRDQDWVAVLSSMARARQWQLRPEVLATMLEWLPRRLPVMEQALDALDHRALAHRKRPSQAWMRRQLREVAETIGTPSPA